MDIENNGMRFTPHKNNSHKCCCALGCKSYSKKDPTLRFHSLPKAGASKVEIINKLNNKENVDRRLIWIKRLKISPNFMQPTVCSLHFTSDDYFIPFLPTDPVILKKNAVPSVNLPTDLLKIKTKDLIRNQRTVNRATKRQLLETDGSTKKKRIINDSARGLTHNQENNFPIQSNSTDDYVQAEWADRSVRVKDKTVHLEDKTEHIEVHVELENFEDPVVGIQHKCIQVDCERFKNFIRDEKDLNTMTGLNSFCLLDLLETIVKTVVPTFQLNLCKETTRLTTKDRIVLTFMKLKQNVSYTVLSVFFRVDCEATCRRIALRMLDILSVGLKPAIRWPSKQEVLKNIPICFVDYSNVRAVIDGIEIQIQKPKNVCCQSDAYSSYKSSYTVKFITAVSPAGLITFISQAYPGRSSDKAIFDQSNFIKKLEKDDGLMVDKGFLIDDECLKNGIQLIRPPFLRNKKQFTKEEALLSAKIAKARVHIERSNQRLKVFKILSTRLPSYLVGRVDQIFLIICAIVNLGPPILKDDKFISS